MYIYIYIRIHIHTRTVRHSSWLHHYLIGGLEHFFFHLNWECHHPNWRTHIFQRVVQPPAILVTTFPPGIGDSRFQSDQSPKNWNLHAVGVRPADDKAALAVGCSAMVDPREIIVKMGDNRYYIYIYIHYICIYIYIDRSIAANYDTHLSCVRTYSNLHVWHMSWAVSQQAQLCTNWIRPKRETHDVEVSRARSCCETISPWVVCSGLETSMLTTQIWLVETWNDSIFMGCSTFTLWLYMSK